MAGGALRVEGLKELDRALRNGDRQMQRDLRKRMSGVAKIVSDEGRELIASKYGGKASRQIRPRVRGTTAYAESRARSKGIRPHFGSLVMRLLIQARHNRYQDALRELERVIEDLAHGFNGRTL